MKQTCRHRRVITSLHHTGTSTKVLARLSSVWRALWQLQGVPAYQASRSPVRSLLWRTLSPSLHALRQRSKQARRRSLVHLPYLHPPRPSFLQLVQGSLRLAQAQLNVYDKLKQRTRPWMNPVLPDRAPCAAYRRHPCQGHLLGLPATARSMLQQVRCTLLLALSTHAAAFARCCSGMHAI